MKLDPVYLRLDPLIGGHNYLTLVSNLVLLAGIFVLTSGIARAVAEETTTPTWIVICMILSGVILTVLFLLLTPQPTTTTFNISYRNQPLTLVHTSFLALVMALAFSGTAIVCLREFSSLTALTSRIGVAFIVAGCVSVVVLTVSTFFLNFGMFFNASSAVKFGNIVYNFTRPLSIVLLAIGMALPPAAAWLSNQNADRVIHRNIESLKPIHERLETAPIPDDATSRQRLTRMIVDINDKILRHGQEAVLQNESPRVLEQAETALLTQTRHTAYPHNTKDS